ncbi:MAG: CDP-alcohol phosphatidyltransferase family protein [Gallicola sp.]|nr:CDP-alcohol phosphatidyltransferase family protein [Gallicola sp.]
MEENRIITIPNVLSLFRIFLIPVFVYFYLQKRDYILAGMIIILSGVTDLVDGSIARRFNMITKVGKVLDPIADKLTQVTVLFCLTNRYPFMMIPFILLFIKEIATGIAGFMVIQKTGRVYGANWHGKLTTVLLYIMLILHLFWYNISSGVSNTFIFLCIGMMLVSFILYTIQNIKLISEEK